MLREIRWLDGVNTIVAVAMLIVAIAAYRVAGDTRDIKDAVSNLSELANQTRREADSQSDQLKLLKAQTQTLSGQLEESRKQTKLIADQTAAIKSSSDASIRSAKAQQTMAEVTSRAEKPDVAINELHVDGIAADPLFWRFRDIGGSAMTVKKVIFNLFFGDALPDTIPQGTFINGQDTVIDNSITSAFSPKDPIPFNFPKDVWDAVKAGTKKVFFWAVFSYLDALGSPHSRCFGRQFIMNSNGSKMDAPSGGPAYRCAT